MIKKFSELKKELLDNEEFKKEYDSFQLEYEIIKELIELRTKEKLTQEELANRIGIPKSNISRFENGRHTPTLETLSRFAAGLNKRVVITFIDL